MLCSCLFKSLGTDFGEKNTLSFLVNVSNGREKCGRELVLLFLNPSSSSYTKAEYNEIGREQHLPCLVVNKQSWKAYNR